MGRKALITLAVVASIAAYAWATGRLAAAPTPPSSPSTHRGQDLSEYAAEALQHVSVRPETSLDGYDRDRWRHWTTGRDGCDSRQATLINDAWRVEVGEDCAITGGVWRSRYDRVRHTDPGELQIDHVVPLKEAEVSGAARWPAGRRERFANDPLNLRAVTGSLNQSKGDQDPAEWLPTYGRCDYVAVWVVLKDEYRLSMDRTERRAVEQVLSSRSCRKGGGQR